MGTLEAHSLARLTLLRLDYFIHSFIHSFVFPALYFAANEIKFIQKCPLTLHEQADLPACVMDTMGKLIIIQIGF